MKYSIYQMDIVPGNPQVNREKIALWIKGTTASQPADILVLPELWTTAYDFASLGRTADENLEPTMPFLCDLAQQYGVNIIAGSIANRKEDDQVYNTAVAIDRRGSVVNTYDKVHLVPMLDEPDYFGGGVAAPAVFELDGVRMATVICYDLRFPEIIRPLAVEGAQILHVVAEWPTARMAHWRALLTARAIENGMFVVACNRVGSYDGTEFCGTSMVTRPDGTVQCEGSQAEEETLFSQLDLSLVEKMRRSIPVFRSRRPELYR